MSYAAAAAKGPQQTPEEVRLLRQLFIHVPMFVLARTNTTVSLFVSRY